MRGEDLISHPNKIMGKKSIKHRIFDALCFLFWNFQFNQKQPLTSHLSPLPLLNHIFKKNEYIHTVIGLLDIQYSMFF